MMLGSVAGGAVRLGEIGASGVVGLGEGIGTCLSVMQACPELPVWAALSSGNLEQVMLPPRSHAS
jgi:putative DNA primase/helicase